MANKGNENISKEKQKLYLKKLNNASPENINKYKTYRNKLNNVMRRAERAHYTRLMVVHKGNMNKSWEVIKEIIGKKRKHSKKKLKFMINEIETGDDEKISNSFNDFFANIGTVLDRKIPVSTKSPLEFMEGK